MNEAEVAKAMVDAKKYIPQSDIEFNAMTTDPVWGRNGPEVPPELRNELTETLDVLSRENVRTVETRYLWNLLSFYTRDLRLGNLQQHLIYGDEVKQCRHYLDLAGDLLHKGMRNAFIVCLRRVATILELSQSRGGWFRRRLGTITGESFTQTMDPPKKNMFMPNSR